MRAFLVLAIFIAPTLCIAGTRTGTLRTANSADTSTGDIVRFENKFANGEITFSAGKLGQMDSAVQTFKARQTDFTSNDLPVVQALVRSRIEQKEGKSGWVTVLPDVSESFRRSAVNGF